MLPNRKLDTQDGETCLSGRGRAHDAPISVALVLL
jgi:hypothetical protein